MQLRLQFDTLKTPQNLFYAQNTNLFQKKLKWATQGFVLELIKRSCMGRFYYAENVILLCLKFASMFHWGKFIIIFSIFLHIWHGPSEKKMHLPLGEISTPSN